MKPTILNKALIVFASLQLCTGIVSAQQTDSTAVAEEKPKKDNRPVKNMFESGYLMNNQTAAIPTPNTLEFVIQHRFGLLNSKDFDLGGLYAPSNIRIGFNYSLTKDLLVGIGTTKNNKLQDANVKYAIIKQTRSGSIPLSITYFGDMAIDVRKDAFPKTIDRLSYFNQIIFARKFNDKLSLQLAPSYSHFNMVDSLVKHGNIAVAFSGRYKLTEALAITLEYEQNFTTQNTKVITVKPNLGIGLEAATSSHVFQVFVSTGQSIINQYNVLYNKNDFAKMDICIGFNMTRLWNY
jgi:hypothetical protein